MPAATKGLPNKHDELDALAERFAGPIERLLADFREEQQKGMDERDTSLMSTLQKQIEENHAKWVKETEAVDRKYQMPGSESGDDGKRKGQTFSIARMGLAAARKDWTLAPFEQEVSTQIHKALSTDVDSAGGYLVPEEQSNQIIDLLRANVVVMKLGATERQGGRPFPLKIPKLTGDVTATWISENETIPESQITLGQLELKPRKLASLTKMSTELIAHSTPTADAVVRDSIVQQMSLALDYAALRGTGNDMPVGVLNLAANTVDFATGTAPAIYFNLMGMLRALALDNAMPANGRLGFAAHPDVIFAAQVHAGDKASSASDPEVARRLLTEKPLTMMVGYTYETTTQLAAPTGTTATGTGAGSLIFGNWVDLWIGRWAPLAIRASDTAGTSFEQDQVWIRGIMRADTLVARPESFVVDDNFPTFV